jgi:methionyl-tRNA formyltransferase
MRVIFMGYQTWGHQVLAALLQSPHDVPLVITHPNSTHEYETIWNDSVAELAESQNVPCVVCRRVGDEAYARIREVAPDILISSDWRTWIPPPVYQTAKHGAINIHDALLPKYGGFAPLNWALINGETEVGVTVHFMSEEFDLGDIIIQEHVPVEPKDTVTHLFHKTIKLFPRMALEALDLIASGRGRWQPQNPAEATFFHKRSIEDSRIDWHRSALEIVNLVRAQADPYPNAFAYYNGQRPITMASGCEYLRHRYP